MSLHGFSNPGARPSVRFRFSPPSASLLDQILFAQDMAIACQLPAGPRRCYQEPLIMKAFVDGSGSRVRLDEKLC